MANGNKVSDSNDKVSMQLARRRSKPQNSTELMDIVQHRRTAPLHKSVTSVTEIFEETIRDWLRK